MNNLHQYLQLSCEPRSSHFISYTFWGCQQRLFLRTYVYILRLILKAFRDEYKRGVDGVYWGSIVGLDNVFFLLWATMG